MQCKKLLLAAGGTGGHVFPALATIEKANAAGIECLLITDKRGGKYVNIPNHKTISCGHLVGGIWHKIRNLSALSYGFLQTLLIIKKFRPDIVIGYGSYTSFAPLLIANLLGIKTILHEQNAIMGKTNRFLAKYADKVLVSFANTGKIPDIKGRIIHTGNPVRLKIMSLRENYIPSYNLLIIGGSQGSKNLSENITKALLSLPDSLCEKLQITMQVRPEMIEDTRQKLAKFNIEIAPFFSDIPTKLSNASLVISRSGASSVSEIIAAARPSLLIPLPSSSENHQYENALAAENIGIGKIIQENDDCWQEIAKNIEYLFNNPHELSQMHDNACKIPANDAAKSILEQLCE